MTLPLKHVSVRLETGVIGEVDTLADLMTSPGNKKNRSTALRTCILVGLEVLLKKHAKKTEPSEPASDDLEPT